MVISKNVELIGVEESELSEKVLTLRKAARLAAQNAYAPFSKFYVGAALVLENGVLLTGNNQENAAFPSGLCAERVVLFHAGAQYPGVPVEMISVFAQSEQYEVPEVLCPCGACLQVMAETRKRQRNSFQIWLDSGEKLYMAAGIESLLPFSFELKTGK